MELKTYTTITPYKASKKYIYFKYERYERLLYCINERFERLGCRADERFERLRYYVFPIK